MKLAIVKVNLSDRSKDEVVFRTNSYDEAWSYVHSHEEENLKVYDTTLRKEYK